MSEFVTGTCEIGSAGDLVLALVELGFQPEEIEFHVSPQPLYGYKGDERPEKADVIIRRKHVGEWSNDIGFMKGSDGKYTAIISEFDRTNVVGRHGSPYDDAWVKRLAQAAGLSKAKQLAKKKGLVIKQQETLANGNRVVVFGR